MRFAVVLALLAAVATPARSDEWQRLGARQVNFRAERDTIPVGAAAGRFTRLKVDVDGGNLEMYDIRVVFENGDAYTPETRVQFQEDSRSRTLDLPGEARAIDRLEFRYRSRRERGMATVTVFGKAAGGGAEHDKGANGSGSAEPAGAWHLLGERMVDFEVERNTIPVTGREGRYRALRLEVEGGNVDLYNLRITFGDDQHYSPETRLEFRQGTSSRTIDLPGEVRNIRRVEFWYRSELKRGRGTIRVFGFSDGAPAGGSTGGGEQPPAAKDAKDLHPGWNYLAARTVAFGADRDTISLKSEGRFTALRVDVAEGDLEMFDVVIHFANGETMSPKTRLVFDQGARTRDLDLPGKGRAIDRIVFAYRSKSGGRDGRATIRLYGRR